MNRVLDLYKKLIGLTEPNNIKIESINNDLDEAKSIIEEVTKENSDYSDELDKLRKNNEDLLELKETLIPLAKKYVSVIEDNNLSFDVAKINSEAKKIVDEALEKEQEIEGKIKDNEIKKESAEVVVSEAPLKLKEEKDAREAVIDLLEIAKNDVSDLTISRIRDTFKKLDMFTDEEIDLMVQPILFPTPAVSLEVAYNIYEDKKGKSTKDMVKEALASSKVEDEPKKDTFKVKSQEKVVEKEPVKESIKVVETESKKDNTDSDIKTFIMDNLGVTQEDIDFNEEITKLSKKELEDKINILKNNDIDPKTISLKVYIEDTKQFVENVKEIRKYFALDSKTVARHPYLAKVPTNRISKDLSIVNKSGISLIKMNGKPAITVLSRNADKLNAAINMMAELDYEYFLQRPEKMAHKISDIAGRIYYCQTKGIDYKEDNYKLVENDKEFSSYYEEGINSSIIPSSRDCNQEVLNQISNPEIIKSLMELYRSGAYLEGINIPQDKMGRFNEICAHVNGLNNSELNSIIEINGFKVLASRFYTNLSQLLSKDIEASDKDLIIASLMYGTHSNVDKVRDVANTFDPNHVRGLAA